MTPDEPLGNLARPPAPPPRAGRLLISAPGMADPRFARTVILLLQHDADGSAGVILNRPSPAPVSSIALPDWLLNSAICCIGGPVKDSLLALGSRAAVPHALQRALGPGVCVVDLDRIVGVPPFYPVRLFVGYAGWSAGQLDAEIERHDWHVVAANAADILLTPPDKVWPRVLGRQVGPLRLWSTIPESVATN